MLIYCNDLNDLRCLFHYCSVLEKCLRNVLRGSPVGISRVVNLGSILCDAIRNSLNWTVLQ